MSRRPATGRLCGVLGDPIEHSLSPVLHRAGYAAAGLDWSYDAHRVAAGGLAAFLDGLDEEWRGLSLTMPLKREAVPLVDDLTDRARLAGAVNTLVLSDEGVLGDNTDVPGAVAALREGLRGLRAPADLSTAVVLGGGATATSTGLALLELGVRRLELVVRVPDRAGGTVAALRAHPAAPDVSMSTFATSGPLAGDVLVSTVPAAAQTPELVARCAALPAVFEVLYDPWPTPLAAAALADGRPLVTGLDLLVHQAALQFELFTGHPAPLAAMRDAGTAALAARTAR